MSRNKTHEQYVEELKTKNPNVIALGKYVNAKTRINHMCVIHNYEWLITPIGALNGNGCPECHKQRLSESKSKTHDDYIRELYNVHPNIKPLEEYKGALVPIKHQCLIDNHIWVTSPVSVLNHDCPKCSNKAVPTQEEYIDRLKEINPSISVIGKYTTMKNNIKVRCDVDGFEWEARADVLLRGSRCPFCASKSLGEISIKNYLDNHMVEYECQKRFAECKSDRTLPFDFYIAKTNTCIEYDGVQHFEPVDFAGRGYKWAEEQYNKTRERDLIKDNFCRQNGITLIRIPYYKDIESELNLLFV